MNEKPLRQLADRLKRKVNEETEGFCIGDVAEMLGCSYNTARQVVKEGLESGLLETHKFKRRMLNGIFRDSYGYRLAKRGKGK